MIIPIGDDCTRYRTPFVTYALILANIAVFAYQCSLEEADKILFLMEYSSLADSYSLTRSVTAGFLHADIWHLAGNMWFLFLFGSSVEGKLGHVWMSAMYLVCLIVSDMAQCFFSPAEYVIALGASGAVGGVIGAYWFLFSRCQVEFFFWFFWWWHGRVWVGVHWAVVWLFGWDVFWYVMEAKYELNTGVAHSAHLGGLIAGLLCGLLIRKFAYVKLDGDDMLTRFTVWRMTGGKSPKRKPAWQKQQYYHQQHDQPEQQPAHSQPTVPADATPTAPSIHDPKLPPSKRNQHGVNELPFE